MKGPLPRPGFVEVPSKIPGIVVYAPAPEAADAPAGPVRTVCPTCGAPAAFDPQGQALACERCGTSTREAVAVGSLDRAEGNDFTLEALRRGAQGWGVERRILHCEGCGADLVVEPGALATTCALCASHQVALAAGDPQAVRPGYLLPFRLRADDLREPLREWLGRGWMHPSSLARMARLERFVGLYVPYWVFDADARADYECEVGHERRVTRRDDDGNPRTETVIDWRWASGTVATRFSGVRVPGTTRLSGVLLERIDRAYDLDALVPYEAELLAGFQAQAFDVALPEAWEAGRARIRDGARRACERDAGGDRIRNLTMTASLDREVWRYVLVPVHVTAYRFDDRVFQVLINGQTGEVHGQKPVVWWRIYAVIAAMFLPAVCSGVIGVPLLLAGGVGTLFLVLAFILLVLAGVGSAAVYGAAARSEAA